VFTTAGGQDTSGIVSDDFSSPQLDTSVWTFVDPLNDGTLSLTGTHLELTAPAGAIHDIWTNGRIVPRVMQAANNADFELEVKFDSALNTSGDFQSQGILVEADSENFLRLELHSYNSKKKLYAASFTNNSPSTRIFASANVGVPNYLRVTRVGDQWTLEYSLDGATWVSGGSFSHALTVTAVGVYVGSGQNAPHTAIVDYVFNNS
jgi:regulation of enolase protein 1 (concanavalin A-like superfamily)